MERVREKVSAILWRGRTERWDAIQGELNRFLRGWAAYFSYGTPLQSFRNVDVHVAHRARNFLRRRHRLPASSRRLSWAALHQEHGILLLYGLLQPHAVT